MKKVTILMYHRITDEPVESLREYAVSPGSFAEQMEYLHTRGFQTVSLGDVLDYYQTGRSLPRRAVVITFDDGYLDNYVYAFPVLRRYGFTATIFQVAGHVGGVAEWDRSCGKPVPRLMSWGEIRLMADDGITFGAHTCSHPFLTRLPLEAATREIAESKAIMEAGLQRKVEFFAYPYKEHSEELRQAVAESGFAAACSSIGGQSDVTDDPFMLKRGIVLRLHTLSDFRWLVDTPDQHSVLYRMVRGKRAKLIKAVRARL